MTIASLFSPNLTTFLRELEDVGISLCLVGGAPRDYLKDRNYLSHDLDFEVRGVEASFLKSYFKNKEINFTELPYEILRVNFEDYDLEFSSPRTERPISENKSHHHFEAVLNPAYSYEESFKRRDFTLNAIGIEIGIKNGTEAVIDPYQGIKALQSGILKEISPDFFLDSVRFLRLIRFMIKYNFEMSESIEKNLTSFDLSELSIHHFIEEMMKSKKPGIFINAFNNLVKLYQLTVPASFSFWRDFKFFPDVETKDDLLVDAFLQNREKATFVAKFLSMPEKRLKDLCSFHESINNIKNATKEDFLVLSKMDLDKISDLTLIKDLKNLEEKKEWRVYSNDSLLINWADWAGIEVGTDEIEATPIPLRSYVKFHKAIKKVFGNG